MIAPNPQAIKVFNNDCVESLCTHTHTHTHALDSKKNSNYGNGCQHFKTCRSPLHRDSSTLAAATNTVTSRSSWGSGI